MKFSRTEQPFNPVNIQLNSIEDVYALQKALEVYAEHYDSEDFTAQQSVNLSNLRNYLSDIITANE